MPDISKIRIEWLEDNFDNAVKSYQQDPAENCIAQVYKIQYLANVMLGEADEASSRIFSDK